MSGSWRRLVYGAPGPGDGQIDRHAYTFCVLEALWSALRSKDVYAVGAGRSGDPRARLIPDALWSVHSGSILTALGLDADPGAHLRKLAGDLGEVYRELAGSLDANPAITIKAGRLSPAKLEAANGLVMDAVTEAWDLAVRGPGSGLLPGAITRERFAVGRASVAAAA